MTVELRSCAELTFREIGRPDLDPESRAACAEHWLRRQEENPALFDGELLLATGKRGRGEAYEVDYFQGRYSEYLWTRSSRGRAVFLAGALYVSVLAITSDGYLIAGRMATDTSTPNRVQLPGGNIEPSSATTISISDARSQAAQELVEETGLEMPAEALSLSHLKSGGDHDDIGVFFHTRLRLTLDEVAAAFESHSRTSADENESAELKELVAFHDDSVDGSAGAPFAVDYMESAIRLALNLEKGPLGYGDARRLSPRMVVIAVEAT